MSFTAELRGLFNFHAKLQGFMRSHSFFRIKAGPFEAVKMRHKAAYKSPSVESLKSCSLNILGEFLPNSS